MPILCILLSVIVVWEMSSLSALAQNYRTNLREPTKSTSFKDCGSEYSISYMKISSCSSSPCKIPVGRSISMMTEFSVYGESVNTLEHEAYWIIKDIHTPVTLSPVYCGNPNLCPYKTSYGMGFYVTIYVNDTLPTLDGDLYWKIRNESGKQVMCYRIPITLKK